MQATLLHVKSLVPPFGIHKHTVRVLPSATTKSSLWFYSAYHLLPPLWMHAAKMKECLRSTAADTRGKCVGLKKPECCWNVLLAYTSPLFILGFFFFSSCRLPALLPFPLCKKIIVSRPTE